VEKNTNSVETLIEEEFLDMFATAGCSGCEESARRRHFECLGARGSARTKQEARDALERRKGAREGDAGPGKIMD